MWGWWWFATFVVGRPGKGAVSPGTALRDCCAAEPKETLAASTGNDSRNVLSSRCEPRNMPPVPPADPTPPLPHTAALLSVQPQHFTLINQSSAMNLFALAHHGGQSILVDDVGTFLGARDLAGAMAACRTLRQDGAAGRGARPRRLQRTHDD